MNATSASRKSQHTGTPLQPPPPRAARRYRSLPRQSRYAQHRLRVLGRAIELLGISRCGGRRLAPLKTGDGCQGGRADAVCVYQHARALAALICRSMRTAVQQRDLDDMLKGLKI